MVAADSFGFGFVGHQYAMSQHIGGNRMHMCDGTVCYIDRAKLFAMIGTAKDHHSNPVHTGDSAIADEWVRIEPGTGGVPFSGPSAGARCWFT